MECKVAKTFNEILKFNPYHDSKGRFTSGGSAASFTIRTRDPGKQYLADMAISREKERTSATTTATKPQTSSKTPEKPQNDSPRMKTIHSVEDKIRNQNFESAAVVDDDGNQLYFKDGQRSQVGFTKLECMQMQNSTLTHNHPRCSMFSPEDLNCMAANGLYEIRATNRDGTTYSMKRADGGYSTQKAMDFVGAYASEYPKSAAYAQNDLDNRGFNKKIWSGEITQAEANREFGRSTAKYMTDWTKKNAPNYGLEFTVEHSPGRVTKALRRLIMKGNSETDIVFALDKDTNNLEDRAFNEWLENAKKHFNNKTAKSFNDVMQEGEKNE